MDMSVKDINEIKATLARITHLVVEAKAERDHLASQLHDCRNELCLKCGDYKTAHLGSCDGCRWRDMG